MNRLKKIDDNLEEYFLVATISISVIVIFLQVIMRYVFKASLPWSEEFARCLFLWQIWVGAAYAAKHSRHLRAEVLKSITNKKYHNYIELIALIIWLGFAIFLTIKGAQVVQMIGRMKQLSPAMRMPMVIPYLSVPVGSVLMVYRLIQNLATLIKTMIIDKKVLPEGVEQ
ncbi:TRAP transporter small permease [Anaerovorax sp. IOR16]|uniref:TRAP transporter small permease n=1 Tax=Anaerovorax sp. IOR16 TaxID=2773458 RepID=UPI0019D14A11|nr:TRAP transporter small permease [Anaerovorax sp. IOR16]